MKKGFLLFFLNILLLANNTIYAENGEILTTGGIYYSSVEKTKYGILAGEFDTRARSDIYNGVLFSEDFGQSWEKIGLEDRGITCIDANEDSAIIGTYYNELNQSGLYKLNFPDKTFTSINFPYTPTAIYYTGNYILVGTQTRGIWKSTNWGISWEQKTDSSTYFPIVNTINGNEGIIMAGLSNNLLISSNEGETWSILEKFNNKNIKHIAINNKSIAVGTYTADGIYTSTDQGGSWEKSDSFGNYPAGGLDFFGNCLYSGKSENMGHQVFKSCNNGGTWETVGIISDSKSTRVIDFEFLYSYPNGLIAALAGEGIRILNLKDEYTKNPIFSRPWSDQSYPLIDYLTSYMDHEFPLLGSAYAEPEYSRNTTFNFLGMREKEPELFYSSHNGSDFKLPYGTEVLAVDRGIASYKFCADCGNTIVIDHENGYQTQYMHLQSSGLITNSTPTEVTKGQVIGKVGMTGRTTGPHLHFVTSKDKNNNSTFNDDFPWGITDPFGWQKTDINDPWPNYKIQEQFGATSEYLWEENLTKAGVKISKNLTNTASISRLTLKIPGDIIQNSASLRTYQYLRPRNTKAKYVPGTSFIIELTDLLGNKITQLENNIELIYDLNNIISEETPINALSIYFYDLIKNEWIKLESFINSESNLLHAYTNHLSHFAVFSESSGNELPQTTVSISGESNNGWFTSSPTISLNTNKQTNIVFYSLNAETNWVRYANPFIIDKLGSNVLYFKSIDNKGNEEDVQEMLIKVDASGAWHQQVKVLNAGFSTLQFQ